MSFQHGIKVVFYIYIKFTGYFPLATPLNSDGSHFRCLVVTCGEGSRVGYWTAHV
jgi:hypothetical protein